MLCKPTSTPQSSSSSSVMMPEKMPDRPMTKVPVQSVEESQEISPEVKHAQDILKELPASIDILLAKLQKAGI